MTATSITEMGVTALSAAIRARQVSCVEVMGATLDQIDRYNPAVNAIVLREERAGLLAQAAVLAVFLARLSAGSSIEAKIAMMAITTSNSISVKFNDLQLFIVFISISPFCFSGTLLFSFCLSCLV